ncbi:hypothetical protein BDN70DRAFT_603031 [Pholiota conissans]|uniref:Uncharacterized protein n=1 Tax=Pholiota conissans TaxID=109636 RepID=A0A9P5Z5S9_9AGAR|nr:hypothetical protein BDN70DRAFT_603031 [Pholiota conissans]
MDPISITLAVITLATALKDIIETANAIQDAFSKQPRNYVNAQRLAKSTIETLEELHEIYEEKKIVIEGKKHLKHSIENLLLEIKSVHKQCIRLIPPVSERKHDKFKIAFYSFWHRNEVEQLISDLNEHVNRCLSKFTALSTVRTETHIMEMNHTVSVSNTHTSEIHKILNDFIRGSDVAHGHGNYSSARSAKLFSFAGSSCMPMTWIPDTIPTHELSKAYLRRELGRINIPLLSDTSTAWRWLQKHPQTLTPPVPTYFLQDSPTSDTVLQRDAVILTFRTQSLLEDGPSNYFGMDISHMLTRLCTQLVKLGMFEDALDISDRLIKCWREIQKHDSSQLSSCWLVEALTRRALYFVDMGYRAQASATAEEAIGILQSLLTHGHDSRLETCCMVFLVRNILIQAHLESDSGKALQMRTDATRNLRNTWGELGKISMYTSLSPVDQVEERPLEMTPENLLHEDNSSDDNRFTAALCLLDVAKIELTHNQAATSHKSAKTALEILNNLRVKYPNSFGIQLHITSALKLLGEMKLRPYNTTAENLEYAQQNTTLNRKLALVNPQRYVIPLTKALWYQSKLLSDLGRSDEAQAIYEEMTNLGKLSAIPSHLGVNIPSETEGDYYYLVAFSHYHTGRFTEAVFAAQNAVAQYSAVELIEPTWSPEKRIRALALLCQSLTGSGDYNLAISESLKSLNLIDNLKIQETEGDCIEAYQDIVCTLMVALQASSNPRASTHAHAIDVDSCIQNLSRSGKVKHQWKSAQASLACAYLLRKRGMVEEALSHCRKLCGNWNDMFGESDDDGKLALQYVYCLDEIYEILWEKGETESALFINEKALLVAKDLFNDNINEVVSDTLEILKTITSSRIDLLCDAGRCCEAVELGHKMVAEVRRDPNQDQNALVASLSILTQIQLRNLMPHDALETAKEALSIQETIGRDRVRYSCLFDLSSAYADLGNIEAAIKCLDEAQEEILNQYSASTIDELKKFNEDAYLFILFQRSTLLFARGEYTGAGELVEDVIDMDRKNSRENVYMLKNFAETLMYSRVLFCTLGRHEKGAATTRELVELQENLSATSPGLKRLVDVHMNCIVNQGWWKPVREAADRVACIHLILFS